MIPRIIEFSSLAAAAAEMKKIGVEEAGIRLMSPKARFYSFRIEALPPIAANILKQEALSLGGEAATAYGSVNLSVKSTPVLLSVTHKQLLALIVKLRLHQFGLPLLAEALKRALAAYQGTPAPLKIGKKRLIFGKRTYLMGILNVTPDSFFDGGLYHSLDRAVERGQELAAAGADIIDIGGESTRPGAKNIPVKEEIRRVVPVIKKLAKLVAVPISIDTRKAAVAEAALDAGAVMVNDVSGFRFDRKMPAVVARYQVPVCLMHSQGTPENMQRSPRYRDLLGEILSYLEEGLAIAKNAGILLEKIMVDPGLGFGKTPDHNLAIVRQLKQLKVLGRPILLGPSRKSLIGSVLGLPPEERLEGTAALVTAAVGSGADLVRVHDVKAMARVVKMADALYRGE